MVLRCFMLLLKQQFLKLLSLLEKLTEELISLCLVNNSEETLTMLGQLQKLLLWEQKEQLKLFSEVKMLKKKQITIISNLLTLLKPLREAMLTT